MMNLTLTSKTLCSKLHLFTTLVQSFLLFQPELDTDLKMGGFIAKALQSIVGEKQIKILMTGLPGAGKTTILCRLGIVENIYKHADWSPYGNYISIMTIYYIYY